MSDVPATTRNTREPTAIEVFRNDLARMEQQFSAALPAHIPVERFMRVVMTAIQNNPTLLRCSRQSLFNACVKAAQDGLLPDGREGAIVPFDSEQGGDTASWMPMIYGLRKKARNSGELSDWMAEVVHEGDEFEHQKGDNPFIFHRPAKTGGRTRKVTHAYSIATFKDGTKSREVMTIDEIEEVRKRYSRSKKGPWSDPIAYPEMCRKTVARLHAKQLPMSTDLDTLIRRDDELYDFSEARERSKEVARPNVTNALDYFAGQLPPPADAAPGIDATPPAATDTPPQAPPQQSAVPKNATQYREFFDSVIGHVQLTGDNADLSEWFNSDTQRRLRNACGVVSEQTNEMRAIIAKMTEDAK
jgi:recombination protein RecT